MGGLVELSVHLAEESQVALRRSVGPAERSQSAAEDHALGRQSTPRLRPEGRESPLLRARGRGGSVTPRSSSNAGAGGAARRLISGACQGLVRGLRPCRLPVDRRVLALAAQLFLEDAVPDQLLQSAEQGGLVRVEDRERGSKSSLLKTSGSRGRRSRISA